MSTERAPINVILRGEQSGRQITVMDNVVSADFQGPPLHHHDFDETFYVLEGELTDVRKGGRGRASRRGHGAVA
jgi:mannose-6-phosphate isomerase-like protein (cupin superfamily)